MARPVLIKTIPPWYGPHSGFGDETDPTEAPKKRVGLQCLDSAQFPYSSGWWGEPGAPAVQSITLSPSLQPPPEANCVPTLLLPGS
jgi:hypothetical protein